MTGTYTKKGEIVDAVKGGWIEFGTISINPASVAADAQGIETTTVDGANTGDMVFVNAQALPKMIACVGGKITAADTLSLYFNNTYDATTAVDVGAITVDVMIVRFAL